MACELRGANGDVLHEVVQEGWARLRARLAEAERGLPRHVVAEVEAYLRCGDPAYGFAWLVCEPCGEHRLVPFSCKKRGFCPACAGRRMAETAASWVEKVFPRVRSRQWVVTVPFRRRVLLARNVDLERGVHRVAMGCIERWYAREANGGQTGSVTVTQRFGSALQLNLHFHSLHPDGTFVRDHQGVLRFREVRAHPADVQALVGEIAERCEAWLARAGHGADDEVVDPDDDGLGLFQQAAAAGYSVVRGKPTRVARRVQVIAGKERALPPLCASCDGYNLHAGVVVEAEDREGLERLGRYLLRPPLAQTRLEVQADGSVSFQMKRAYADGSQTLAFSAEELVARLVAIVPPAEANQIVYRGVLAGNAALRKEVVALARPKARVPDLRGEGMAALSIKPRGLRAKATWAELLWRVFSVDGWRCTSCGGRMALRHVMGGGPATSEVLGSLQRAGLRAARAPP